MNTKNTGSHETWSEALLIALGVIWFIIGMAAPAPALPFFFLLEKIGLLFTIGLAILATVIWLGVPFLLIRRANKMREKRLLAG